MAGVKGNEVRGRGQRLKVEVVVYCWRLRSEFSGLGRRSEVEVGGLRLRSEVEVRGQGLKSMLGVRVVVGGQSQRSRLEVKVGGRGWRSRSERADTFGGSEVEVRD